MNYTMGRYIDEGTDEMRDRLLTAEEFSDGAWWNGWCGCLVATGEGARSAKEAEQRARAKGIRARGLSWQGTTPAYRYPRALERFGKPRVVRALKLRAAAAMSSEYERQPEPTSEPVQAQ